MTRVSRVLVSKKRRLLIAHMEEPRVFPFCARRDAITKADTVGRGVLEKRDSRYTPENETIGAELRPNVRCWLETTRSMESSTPYTAFYTTQQLGRAIKRYRGPFLHEIEKKKSNISSGNAIVPDRRMCKRRGGRKLTFETKSAMKTTAINEVHVASQATSR